MRKMILCLVMVCLLAVPVLAAPVPAARVTAMAGANGTVTLWWDANTEVDLAGYKVYWGRASRTYTNSPIPTVAVMTSPTFTTSVLANGTWYFAVTAYNTAGMESGYSNEVSDTVAVAPSAPKNLRKTILMALASFFRAIFGPG
jgi:hypothetical protein